MVRGRIETVGRGSPHVSREVPRYGNLVQLEGSFDSDRGRRQKLGVI